jgi:hypothetical protein
VKTSSVEFRKVSFGKAFPLSPYQQYFTSPFCRIVPGETGWHGEKEVTNITCSIFQRQSWFNARFKRTYYLALDVEDTAGCLKIFDE